MGMTIGRSRLKQEMRLLLTLAHVNLYQQGKQKAQSSKIGTDRMTHPMTAWCIMQQPLHERGKGTCTSVWNVGAQIVAVS